MTLPGFRRRFVVFLFYQETTRIVARVNVSLLNSFAELFQRYFQRSGLAIYRPHAENIN